MKLQHYLGGLEGLGPVDVREAGVRRALGEAHLRHPRGDDGAELATAAAADAEQIQHGLDLGGSAQGRGIPQPARLLQVPLLREMARRHFRLFRRKGLHHRSRARRAHRANSQRTPSAPRAQGGDPAIDRRVVTYLVEGDSPKHDTAATPRFAVGDKVFVKNPPTIEHTRLPGYLRNRDRRRRCGLSGGPTAISPRPVPTASVPPMPVYCVRFDPEICGRATRKRTSRSTPTSSRPISTSRTERRRDRAPPAVPAARSSTSL